MFQSAGYRDAVCNDWHELYWILRVVPAEWLGEVQNTIYNPQPGGPQSQHEQDIVDLTRFLLLDVASDNSAYNVDSPNYIPALGQSIIFQGLQLPRGGRTRALRCGNKNARNRVVPRRRFL